ncbi:Protein Ycf2 (chloroplast) [Pelargonium x hortorum] [Rhizoctonia solani]|uniref:Protein Ycf2 (Chloroplast) [Pelargonium x hortorum] n=1 Tax=Rhizoctonia solani TaxID=456999 RepID=A0A0K6FP74_9AGAM|nr:Protein Ycf2 (chloroplast) [Pelargonium x hortorum] [Rhizoctonia solani]
MPLYLLVRPSPKRGEKGKTGLHGYMHKYRKRAPIVMQSCYPVDAPQEFDDEGKELDADAQVWKTYVREADQVDEEMVDGWNKSMDVILIFAALFSAISTAFVIESYKNLKPDPADASSQTLLIISQTLMLIANGSQPSSTSPISVSETTAFEASAKDICVNVLWFLSLSLSVAVSLISMLAKEWCLEFMSGRTGPAGPQACRRQQRWDGLVKWKMKEVILMLPSLIHVSLLLFAIGLCVFLWDVHYGVAIPVVIVTTIAAGAYFACTIVPLLYQFCPYGTVLSRAIRQFKNGRSRITLTDWMNRDAISNALHWMITNCETPRSVDIALQSLAAADDGKVSRAKLEEVNAWGMIKQRFTSTNVSKKSEQSRNISQLYKRALEALPTTRSKIDAGFYYSRDETRKLEQLVIGIQSTINGLIHEVLANTRSLDPRTTHILKRCTLIGPHYIGKVNHPDHEFGELHQVNPTGLAEEIVNILEPYLTIRGADPDPALCRTLLASLAFVLCCNVAREPARQSVYVGYVMRLIRGHWLRDNNTSYSYSHSYLGNTMIFYYFVLVTLWLSISSGYSDNLNSPLASPYASIEETLETLWAGLIQIIYSDSSALNGHVRCWQHGIIYLLANPNHYNLTNYDSGAIALILRVEIRGVSLPSGIDIEYHTQYINNISRNMADDNVLVKLAPQFLTALHTFWSNSSLDRYHCVTSEMYILVVKALCLADYNDMNLADRWRSYQILHESPLPVCSPQLIQQLSSSGLIRYLSDLASNNDTDRRIFATAQLWLWFNMSLSELDRTNPALTTLEKALLQYPGLENKLENQEQVAEGLEKKLMDLLDELDNENGQDEIMNMAGYLIRGYACRVIQIMFQKRYAPLPKNVSDGLRLVSEDLRGIESFKNLDTDGLITVYGQMV